MLSPLRHNCHKKGTIGLGEQRGITNAELIMERSSSLSGFPAPLLMHHLTKTATRSYSATAPETWLDTRPQRVWGSIYCRLFSRVEGGMFGLGHDKKGSIIRFLSCRNIRQTLPSRSPSTMFLVSNPVHLLDVLMRLLLHL